MMTYRVHCSEYDVDPAGNGNVTVVCGFQRGETHVDPEKGQEWHGLLQKIAHRAIPAEHRTFRHVVVSLELHDIEEKRQRKDEC